MDFNEIYGSALREADYVNNDTKETVAFKAAELIREYFNAIDKSIEIDISENGEFDTTDGANGEGMIDSVNVHVGKDGWLQVFSYENTDNEVFISLASLDSSPIAVNSLVRSILIKSPSLRNSGFRIS